MIKGLVIGGKRSHGDIVEEIAIIVAGEVGPAFGSGVTGGFGDLYAVTAGSLLLW